MNLQERRKQLKLSEPTNEHNQLQDADLHDNKNAQINLGSVLCLALVFISFVVLLFTIYTQLPTLETKEKTFIKLPKNIDDAKNLGAVLRKYNQDHFYSVLAAFFCAYVFLQTFAIPGSIFLSILSGFLYPFPLALTLVCTCSTLGASLCYLLSNMVARRIIMKYLNGRLTKWQAKVNSKKNDMLYYMIFLRVTPIVPNWFINLSSPLIDIPAMPFALGTFIGVAPPSCVYIQAGTTLNKLTSATAVFSWQSIVLLILFAVLSLLPVLFKNYLRKKLE